MTSITDADVSLLHEKVIFEIGPQSQWPVWRDGWDRADLAILDAVYSARQQYEKTVRPKVKAWESLHPSVPEPELQHLIECGEAAIREVFGRNVLPGVRIPGTRIGKRKSEGVIEVAKLLCRDDVRLGSASLIRQAASSNKDEVVRLLRSVKGIGPATATYFLMLLGVDGVKVDTLLGDWVRRQVSQPDLSQENVSELVTRVAKEKFSCDVTALDYAIWSHESNNRKR